MQLNPSDMAQHSGERIRRIMISTDIDTAQNVRHSSTLRTEDKEDNDQHRHKRSSTRQTRLNTQEEDKEDNDQHRHRHSSKPQTLLNTQDTG